MISYTPLFVAFISLLAAFQAAKHTIFIFTTIYALIVQVPAKNRALDLYDPRWQKVLAHAESMLQYKSGLVVIYSIFFYWVVTP